MSFNISEVVAYRNALDEAVEIVLDEREKAFQRKTSRLPFTTKDKCARIVKRNYPSGEIKEEPCGGSILVEHYPEEHKVEASCGKCKTEIAQGY